MYEPSMASGTTFIVFNTTTNNTTTTATFAASPARNARMARCGSVAASLPKATNAIARLAMLLIPPPSSAETAARESASPKLTSAHSRVTAAWPSTTLRASRRGLGRSIAITAFPLYEPQEQRIPQWGPGLRGPDKKPADYRDRTRGSPHSMTSRSSAPRTSAPSVPVMVTNHQKSRAWARQEQLAARSETPSAVLARPSRAVMSVDVREDAVELVEAVVTDDQLALAAAGMLDRNLGAELLGQLLLETIDVGVARRICLGAIGRRLLQTPHERLGITHRQALLDDNQGRFDLLLAIRQRQQSPSVAHFELALLHVLRDFRSELQQAQQVAHTRSGPPHRVRGLLMGQREFVDEPLQRTGLFERIQILALNVFYESD